MKEHKLDKIRSIRINSSLDQQLHEYAGSVDCSANHIINEALAEYLRSHSVADPKTSKRS